MESGNLPFIVSGAATWFSLDDSADKSLSCLLPREHGIYAENVTLNTNKLFLPFQSPLSSIAHISAILLSQDGKKSKKKPNK